MAGIFKAFGSIVSSILGSDSPVTPAAPPPTVTKPTAMPTMDDAAIKAAQQASLVATQTRQGRMSTILTQDDNQRLGG